MPRRARQLRRARTSNPSPSPSPELIPNPNPNLNPNPNPNQACEDGCEDDKVAAWAEPLPGYSYTSQQVALTLALALALTLALTLGPTLTGRRKSTFH